MLSTAQIIKSLLCLILIWQSIIYIFSPPHYLLPAPLSVMSAFARQGGFLLSQSIITGTEILIGLICGSLLGISTAFAVSRFPRFGNLIWPMVMILQAFPVFVLAPILVLWFGFGMMSKVVMTTLIIYFPVASAFADGLRRTDRSILDAVALTPATRWHLLIHVRAPLALPSLISGLRVAATLAPLGAIVGEWVGASAGLGFVMLQANARMQTDMVFAAMSIIAMMTVSLRASVDWLSRSLVHWQPEIDTLPIPKKMRLKDES
jgi:putative hydroxymethylpyrimidine transport system permease protein